MAEKKLGWKANVIISIIVAILVQSMCRAVHVEQTIQPADGAGILLWWSANRPIVVGYCLWFWAFEGLRAFSVLIWRAWNEN